MLEIKYLSPDVGSYALSPESLQGLAVKGHRPQAGYVGATTPGPLRSAQGVSSTSCLKGSGSWTLFLKLVTCAVVQSKNIVHFLFIKKNSGSGFCHHDSPASN